MLWLQRVWLRLWSLLLGPQLDQELDDELRFHLEQQIEENMAAGMPPEEAHYAARRAIGRAEQIKEECRDMRRVNWVPDLAQDIRYGLRMLGKSPSFTAVPSSLWRSVSVPTRRSSACSNLSSGDHCRFLIPND
ncbi:MAG: hypothetical protein DMG57_08085 [Acidobacteria bacterium]|nr:MAG: hypothetical protein DMG57_08085 [Acidobacteriota bacterium]